MDVSTVPARANRASFVVNRVLVAGLLAGVLATFLAIADRMLAAGWSSQIDVAMAVTAALGTGAIFAANYRRCVRLIDRLVLPKRYAATVALERIAASLRQREARMSDRIAADVAEALGLSSLAVFARTSDDGFVRRAAHGWPAGSAWHLLPGEPLTLALSGRARLVSLASASDVYGVLPSGAARPCVAITVRRGGSVRGAVVLGPDGHGFVPDADTVRALAALFGETVFG